MNSLFKEKSEKRIKIGNYSLVVALLLLTFGCWNEIEWYEFTAPLGTIVSTFFLAITLFCYVDIKEMIRDKEFYLIVIASIITIINIFVVNSGLGAFFTVTNLLLVLYLADKIQMSKKMLTVLGVYIAFFFYYWTVDVKGYFKGYNTNYGGLVLITGFAFAIVMLLYFQEKLKEKGKETAYKLMYIPIIFMFLLGYNIISWYRARCALLGLIVIAFIMIIPRKIWKINWIYNLLVIGSTFGAIAVCFIYIFLGQMKDVFTIRIFYKDILSGRDEIWGELLAMFLQHPLTGIGSNYTMRLEWMEGMFEVHNGLLDILIVHGIFVFGIVIFLLIKKLFGIRRMTTKSVIAKACLAGIMAMLVSSFMENFFIVPPFTLCFLILFLMVRSDITESFHDGSSK